MSQGEPASLPYRPCVGIALFNPDGLVWVGRRADAPEEAEGPGTWWQMPQGGLDPGEDPLNAARRELYEETSVRSVDLIARAPGVIRYDLPRHLIGQSWGGRYRGQEQHWFALRFVGNDSEIDVAAPGGGGHTPEFSEWRWERLENLPALVIGFKRPVYDGVAAAFGEIGPVA